MTKRHRQRRGHTGPKGVVQSITLQRYEVADFFDEAGLEDLMAVARLRILQVFARECEVVRGKLRCTDNYIAASRRPSDLARHVVQHCNRFISRRDLVELIGSDIPRKLVDRLRLQLEYEVLLEQINVMRSKPLFQIYYDEVHGIWQIVQTAMDELYATRARTQELKRDDRSFHGRVRSQSERRGIPPGISIGVG